MSSGKHVHDLIKRVNKNHSLKKASRMRFQKVKKIYITEMGGFNDENNLSKNDLSKEDLEIIKNKIRVKLEAERKRRVILTAFFVTLLCTALFFIFRQSRF